MPKQMRLCLDTACSDPIWEQLPAACRDRVVGIYSQLAVRAAQDKGGAARESETEQQNTSENHPAECQDER
jgi:hypothetical protein